MRRPAARARSIAINLALGLLATTLFLVFVEGAFSLYVGIQRILPDRRAAEFLHTKYDPLLGWVNIPGVEIKDMYGPGRHLRINSQGFRNSRTFAPQVAPGKTRIICSGDSFTLGYGVGNRYTWCALLGRGPGVETVNMGQGGYGLDQAYLWYERDAREIDHQIQLFAFISADFVRLLREEDYGYYKPVLTVEEGRLRVAKLPPKPGLFAALERSPAKLSNFRSFGVLMGWWDRLLPQENSQQLRGPEILGLTDALFNELERLNREKGSRLVAVHLPMGNEFYPGDHDRLRDSLRQIASRHDIPYLDLLEDLRSLTPLQYRALFIGADDTVAVKFGPAAAGHYNERGNALVARILRRHLESLGLLEPRKTLPR